MLVRFLAPAFALAIAVNIGSTSSFAQTPAAPPPLEAYASLPATENVVVSPDGSTLAYIQHGEANQVVVLQRTGELVAIVNIGNAAVRSLEWASPDHVLIVSTSNQHTPFSIGSNLQTIVDILNVRTSRLVRAMNDADVEAYNASFGYQPVVRDGKPMLAFTALSETPQGWSIDLFMVDLDTGKGRRAITGTLDTRDYLLTPTGEPAARVQGNSETGRWRLAARRGSQWADIRNLVALLDGPNVLGLGRTPGTIALSEKVGEGYQITEVSLATGETTEIPIRGGNRSGVTDRFGRLVGLGYVDIYQKYTFLEPKLAEAWATLTAALPNRQITLESFSDDMNIIIVEVEGSGEPGAYFAYDVAAKQVSLVGRLRPGITGAQVAEVRAISYKASDGLEMMGYLTLPPGKPAQNLPLIMLPHGGPASSDTAGFDYWSQALASRGYAVFQPNFRGSTGFGQDFLEAGYGQWGRKMQTDLTDGLKVLVDRGLVDPEKVCIVGASYGGYAAMAGMTIDAGTYRCGVAIAGVADLREMLRSEERQGGRGSRNPTIRYWTRFMGASGVGDPSLLERSPAQLASRLEGPLLLIHGRSDTVVPYEQSEIMLRAAQAAGKTDIRLVPLNGEDHYLTFAPTRLQMLQEMMTFLEAENPPT